MYDAFISYRRDGGHEMARLLYEHLTNRGINCFFDLEELGSGKFDVKLLRNIEQSKNFILVLSPDALARCQNEGDWVRSEIEHAIKHKKKNKRNSERPPFCLAPNQLVMSVLQTCDSPAAGNRVSVSR